MSFSKGHARLRSVLLVLIFAFAAQAFLLLGVAARSAPDVRPRLLFGAGFAVVLSLGAWRVRGFV